MNMATENSKRGTLATLRQFVRKPRENVEVCELCAVPLSANHQHLLELEKRRITCACDACAVLFGGNTRQRYRRIPRDVERLDDFAIDDQDWDALLIPINLAFFVHSSATNRVIAQYPNPAGIMESFVDSEYWNVIAERNPVLKQFEPDIEALLVNRIAEHREYYRAPIDQCFRLVGIIRKHWHGLSGGAEIWKQINCFFEELNEASGDHRA
jgi:hypothetical protein